MEDENFRAAVAAAVALEPDGSDVVVVEADDEFNLATAIEKAEQIGSSWVIEVPFLGELLEEVAKNAALSAFHVDAVPGSLFVTTESLVPGKSTVLVAGGEIGTPIPEVEEVGDEIVEKRVTKILKTAEEKFVLGIVLVPETRDSQGDIYSAAEVRKAAHSYMEIAGHLGKQHGEIVTGKLKILESYIAPVDFEEDGETIAKGTWLMGIRVVDDDLWKETKEGSFTGFSIGGSAVRKPEQQQLDV